MIGFIALAATLGLVLGQLAAGRPPAPALSSTPLPGADAVTGSLERNPIYTASPLTGECRAPDAARPAFLHAMADCMDRSWRALQATSGLSSGLPTRVFWSEPGRGACGDYPEPDAAAFYCPVNNGIYLGVDEEENAMVLTAILAHEYGHHVQHNAGIGDAAAEREVSTPDEGTTLAISRRYELQADCFAGVWFAAVRDSLPVSAEDWQEVLADFARRGDTGDERTHGTGQHGAAWLNGGFRGGRPGHCNTWTAPAADVD
ncbi:neutral zinc metallopeptidase [Nonomuraea sp. NPDC049709]|uniref:neutral zinc metallopeptidase n=1 Tax=Nonomuraea sp. NPDC049709 TaxID=3154736 RepID=UPI0034376F8E